MSGLLKMLKGKRTKLIALGLAILAMIYRGDVLLHDDSDTEKIVELGWMTLEQYAWWGTLLGAGGLAALRAGMPKGK